MLQKRKCVLVIPLMLIYFAASCGAVFYTTPQLFTSSGPAAIATQEGRSANPSKLLLTQGRHLPLVKQPKLSVDVGLVLPVPPPVEQHRFVLTGDACLQHWGYGFCSPLGRAPPESPHLAV